MSKTEKNYLYKCQCVFSNWFISITYCICHVWGHECITELTFQNVSLYKDTSPLQCYRLLQGNLKLHQKPSFFLIVVSLLHRFRWIIYDALWEKKHKHGMPSSNLSSEKEMGQFTSSQNREILSLALQKLQGVKESGLTFLLDGSTVFCCTAGICICEKIIASGQSLWSKATF